MFNWAKQQLANVAGTQEPIYGPEAIQPVTQQEPAFTLLTKDDLRWIAMESTNVETHTFYFLSESGNLGSAQIIYSNVAGLRTTCQFSSKIFQIDGKTVNLWSTDPLENHGFDEGRYSFHATNCVMELSEDGNTYTIKSSTNPKCIVDVKVSRIAPGFVVGKNGTSTFGTDPANPWGSMLHAFWPMCKVEGSFLTQTGEVDFNGRGLFVHALQGMKPHHAAARWNFINFQSPTHSAVLMEFTTPASYGTTTVSVGGIATEGNLVFAGGVDAVKHLETSTDSENDWPEPSSLSCAWKGKTPEGKDIEATLGGSLGTRIDRVDVMAEVPKFIKQIAAGAAGTKPYIYQFAPQMKLDLDLGGEKSSVEGHAFIEATFIC